MLDASLKGIFPGTPAQIGKIDVSFRRVITPNLVEKICDFIRSGLSDLNKVGLMQITVGISGGVDSIVAAYLLHRALAKDADSVIIDFGVDEDSNFSVRMAEKIGIRYRVISAKALLAEHQRLVENNTVLALIHLRSRLINDIIFQIADNKQQAVVDTTDKSERLLARHAESFMGHLMPLGDLYKSELYDLAEYVGFPEVKTRKPGCPELYDNDAFGVDWATLDAILYLLVDKKMLPTELARRYQVDLDWLNIIDRRLHNQGFRTGTKKLQV